MRAVGYDPFSPLVRCLNTVARQQGAFDLHKMHVFRVLDAGIRHRRVDGPCRLLDLQAAAKFFRHEVAGMGNADAQALARDPALRIARYRTAREDRDMRTENAFRAARHHEGDLLFDVMRGQPNVRRERKAQRRHGVFPSEIIYTAIALRLPQDCQDRCRLKLACLDQIHQAGYIAGAFGGYLDHVNGGGAHGHSMLPLCQKMTRSSVHPMM